MFKHLVFIASLMLVVSAQLVFGQGPDGVVTVDGIDEIIGVTGKDYTLQCEQRLRTDASESAPDLSWTRGIQGPAIVDDDNKYDIIDEKDETAKYSKSSLIILDAQLEDNGDYRCNGNSGGTTITLELNIDAEVNITSDSKKFHLAEGLVLRCNVGEEAINQNIEWSYKKDASQDDGQDSSQDESEMWELLQDGKQDLNGDNTDEVEVNGNTVTFLTSDPNAAGTYRCSVDLGSKPQSAVAVVAGLLEVHAPQSIKVSEKEKGVIRCEATSVPKPKIIWSVNGSVIEVSTEKYEIEDITSPDVNTVVSELSILDVTVEDGGSTIYTCSGNNGAEEIDKDVILRIRDPLAALWPFIGIVCEVALLIIIILIHEACTKGEDIGETDDDEEDHLLQKNRSITRDGEQTRMRGTNN